MRSIKLAVLVLTIFFLQGCATKQKNDGNIPPNACVKLDVVVYSDGQVRSMKILETSGSAPLDYQAWESVKSAAPFKPFPEALAAKRDVLQLVHKFCTDSKGVLVNSGKELNSTIKHITNSSTLGQGNLGLDSHRYAASAR